MINKMNGSQFRNMIDYGMRNLHKHIKIVNQLNVFPVPDGDTGTNMVTTIQKGIHTVNLPMNNLSDVSKKIAGSIVLSARGNSGVIVSQFIKGISESFFELNVADAVQFVAALDRGVKCAYDAVITPVEGTMLTVIKEATEAVKKSEPENKNIDEVINVFLDQARISLENTPELLPTLKEAGVVDSGGAGIVYFFEGMKKYLDGDTIEEVKVDETVEIVDYTVFNENSVFEFGYCTELLIQLLKGREPFDIAKFRDELNAIGESVVTSQEGDKVRVHIHTHYPETVFTCCHRYGEFLSLKIENMTVQHNETVKNIAFSKTRSTGTFSVVAVAYSRSVQELFLEMGADVVIYSEESASTKDYLDAFSNINTDKIIVFPNSSDSVLTAVQAQKFYDKAQVTVIESKNIAQCYAALPVIDFEEKNVENVVQSITDTLDNLYVVSVAKRPAKTDSLGNIVQEEDLCAFAGKEIVAVGKELKETVIKTVEKALTEQCKDVVTVFHGDNVKEEFIESVKEAIENMGLCAEVFSVYSEKLTYELTISFE